MVLTLPLLTLYIIGDKFEGWVRYVCWSMFALGVACLIGYGIYFYSEIWTDDD